MVERRDGGGDGQSRRQNPLNDGVTVPAGISEAALAEFNLLAEMGKKALQDGSVTRPSGTRSTRGLRNGRL